MGKKDIVTVAVGLVIMIAISWWAIHGNTEVLNKSLIAFEATSVAIIEQRDTLIKKLIKQNIEKQEELNL